VPQWLSGPGCGTGIQTSFVRDPAQGTKLFAAQVPADASGRPLFLTNYKNVPKKFTSDDNEHIVEKRFLTFQFHPPSIGMRLPLNMLPNFSSIYLMTSASLRQLVIYRLQTFPLLLLRYLLLLKLRYPSVLLATALNKLGKRIYASAYVVGIFCKNLDRLCVVTLWLWWRLFWQRLRRCECLWCPRRCWWWPGRLRVTPSGLLLALYVGLMRSISPCWPRAVQSGRCCGRGSNSDARRALALTGFRA